MVVLADPDSAFIAVNVTEWGPSSPDPGVHVSVPAVFPGPGAKLAPAGSPVAMSDVIDSPSGSLAVTVTVSRFPAGAETLAGALTTGARSTLVTVITVDADPPNALLAVNVTV